MVRTFARQGQYFEEFEVGDVFITAGRTLTEADIVTFAGVSGDYTQLHTNVEVARQGVFGKRVAHGLLGLTIASGLLAQLGFTEGTIMAFREMTWKFSRPITIGDTIRAEAMVSAVKAMRRVGGGAVTLNIEILNQENEVTQRGKWVVLIANRPAQDDSRTFGASP